MGIIGWTTKLEHSGVPATTWTQISETVSIQIPGIETSQVEDTHLGVTNRFRTYVPGLRDAGSVGMEMNYSKASINALNGLTGVMRTWRVTAPDEDGTGPDTAPVFTFQGFISKRDPVEFKADEVVKIKFEIKINGEPLSA
jgi:Lambda phage tail tube protein, TTP